MTGKSGFAEAHAMRLGTEIQWYRTRGPMGPLFVFTIRNRNRNGHEHRTRMSDKATDIAKLLAPTIQSLGLELLGAEYLPAPGSATLRLYIDVPESDTSADGAPRAVTIEDCEAVSREVSAQLDVEDPITGRYTLEVSSPGVDRPLFTAAQFARFAGESAKVGLKLPQEGRRRLTGKILRVEGDIIVFGLDSGDEFVVSAENIEKAKLVPDWVALGFGPAKDASGRDARPGKQKTDGRAKRPVGKNKPTKKPAARKPSSAE